ncbi:MAG: protein arginine kinase [Phycisphaerae bacterium]|nr:MAG: protein arginine kinase [Planctomycetota bacterium]KAB2943736.1 MAG: protein arginine kinase [Phycisphaerae bacterium]MBE7457913.1 protein arginine kinase [Planctomycetia bacterium]MCK6465516.1 protein arginine kinase [Phycisphaerae bacterium]MCL4720105.1 protein arginine kinase [Phycisphaerae bacterium]
MTIDDLMLQRGEWLQGTGPMSDVVISSRIRLARNLANYPFRNRAGESDLAEILRTVSEAALSCRSCKDATALDLDPADPLDRQVLVERHLISRQLADAPGPRGVVVTRGETLAVMINEEDHVRLQALRSGLQLTTLWGEINTLDDELAERVEFAFDGRLGYLTACPTNLGTGIRVSVMLHLPALKLTNEIVRVARAAEELRLAIRGLYGEGTDAVGDFYQISNQTTLGKSEEEIIEEFGESIIPRVVEYERAARQALIEKRPVQLDDRIWRAFGNLRTARIISSEETLLHLSHLRLGIATGRFPKMDVKELNDLIMPTQPAHLQKRTGRTMSGEERGALRAAFLRERLHHLN